MILLIKLRVSECVQRSVQSRPEGIKIRLLSIVLTPF